MGHRLRHNEWQRHFWKFMTHPVTEIAAIVAVVAVALVSLVLTESRALRGPHVPVIFGPR